MQAIKVLNIGALHCPLCALLCSLLCFVDKLGLGTKLQNFKFQKLDQSFGAHNYAFLSHAGSHMHSYVTSYQVYSLRT